jgi:hypothetical protein
MTATYNPQAAAAGARFLAIVLFVASPLGAAAAESVGTITKVQGSTTPAANGTLCI